MISHYFLSFRNDIAYFKIHSKLVDKSSVSIVASSWKNYMKMH